MTTIILKKLNGDIIEMNISVNDTEKDIRQRLNSLYPEEFPLHFTHISRLDKDIAFKNNEIMMCHVDYNMYHIEFPLICPIPSSLDTSMFEEIPGNVVEVIERDIDDKYNIQKFMKIQWKNKNGMNRVGYVQQQPTL